MSFVPIVVEAKPDELLYSWINRLAGANAVHFRLFMNEYMGINALYIGDLDYDVKNEFVSLTEHLYNPENLAKLYEDHSPLRFELMFLNERPGLKQINNVCLRKDPINTSRPKSIDKIHICPECIKADTQYTAIWFSFSSCHPSSARS